MSCRCCVSASCVCPCVARAFLRLCVFVCVALRIWSAVEEFERAVTPGKAPTEPHTHARRAKAAAKCLPFHTSNKTATAVLVYRDSEWVRLPPCLLTEGDIVALLHGEVGLHTHLSVVSPDLKIRDMLRAEAGPQRTTTRASVQTVVRGGKAPSPLPPSCVSLCVLLCACVCVLCCVCVCMCDALLLRVLLCSLCENDAPRPRQRG